MRLRLRKYVDCPDNAIKANLNLYVLCIIFETNILWKERETVFSELLITLKLHSEMQLRECLIHWYKNSLKTQSIITFRRLYVDTLSSHNWLCLLSDLSDWLSYFALIFIIELFIMLWLWHEGKVYRNSKVFSIFWGCKYFEDVNICI